MYERREYRLRLLVGLSLVAAALASRHNAAQSRPSRTQIVLLGTRNPGPTPDKSGPSTAIIVDGEPSLVDFGPGVVRRAAAAQQKGVGAL